MVTKGEQIPIFVYGTLRMGMAASARMKGAKYVGSTRTTHGYALGMYGDLPGMIYTGEHAQVVGEVYLVTPAHLAHLDAYEDSRYLRDYVTLSNGVQVRAYLLPERTGNVVKGVWN